MPAIKRVADFTPEVARRATKFDSSPGIPGADIDQAVVEYIEYMKLEYPARAKQYDKAYDIIAAQWLDLKLLQKTSIESLTSMDIPMRIAVQLKDRVAKYYGWR